MYVIVGLGNPGREYADTRHNIGYMVLDALAARYDIDVRRHNFRSVFGEGSAHGKKLVLAKPETFMNNSGWAVQDLVNWYKCEPRELILIYDDADIPQGTIRVRKGGSAGTHNGMRSVIYQLGFDDFPRVRVGIGKAAHDMVHHVLGVPQGSERAELQEAIQNAVDAVELILQDRLQEAQARYNRKPRTEPDTPEPPPTETEPS